MVDAFPFDEFPTTDDGPFGQSRKLTNAIKRDVFGCFRVSTKVYDEQCLKEAETWMTKQGCVFSKTNVDDFTFEYSVAR